MESGYIPEGTDKYENPFKESPMWWPTKTCLVCKKEAQEPSSLFCFDCHDIGRAMQRERMAALVMGMAVPKADHA